MISGMKVVIKKPLVISLVVLLTVAGSLWWSGAFRKLTGSQASSVRGDKATESGAPSDSKDASAGSRNAGPEPTYFAKVADGKVTQVIVADPEFIKTFNDGTPGEWIQTSYNTSGGAHYDPNTGKPDGKEALRKNTAGIGYSYDKDLDAFIPPQPYKSWKLNRETALWEAPVPMPEDGKRYSWNDKDQSWEEIKMPDVPAPSADSSAPAPSDVLPK